MSSPLRLKPDRFAPGGTCSAFFWRALTGIPLAPNLVPVCGVCRPCSRSLLEGGGLAKKKVTKKKVTKKKSAQKKTASKSSSGSATPSSKKKTSKKAASKKTSKKTTKKVAKKVAKKVVKKAVASKATKKKAASKKTSKKVVKKAAAAKSTSKKTGAKKTSSKKATTKPEPKPVAEPTPTTTTDASKNAGKDDKRKKPSKSKKPTFQMPVRPLLLGPNGPALKPLIPSGKDNKVESSVLDNVTSRRTKTPLTKTQLDRYRMILLQKRMELLGDIEHLEEEALRGDSGRSSHNTQNSDDAGSESYEQSLNLNLAASDRERLNEIEAALQRIKDRTYGLCEMTFEPIKRERLEEIPWTRYTIAAARELDRRGGKR